CSGCSLSRRCWRPGRDLPFLELTFCLLTGNPVPLLDLADELLRTTLDLIEVVVGQLPPFLADFALELIPLAFKHVFVHVLPPFTFTHERVTTTACALRRMTPLCRRPSHISANTRLKWMRKMTKIRRGISHPPQYSERLKQMGCLSAGQTVQFRMG